MAQPNNDQIFYNANDILITQYRFVTHAGMTVPTNTITSAQFIEVPAHRRGNPIRTILMIGLSFIVLLAGAVSCGFAGHYYDADPNPPLAIFFLVLSLTVWPVLWVLNRISKGRKIALHYRCDITFAGGGIYEVDQSIYGHSTYSANIRGTNTRVADYYFWSYDRQEVVQFLDAVNQAIVAAQQIR